ncbi:MAG: hypothetical protein N2515_11505 [Deltaproteobacteria bacterium]|nr:hypothetical protein [Deltaproteobacteria bacterium]
MPSIRSSSPHPSPQPSPLSFTDLTPTSPTPPSQPPPSPELLRLGVNHPICHLDPSTTPSTSLGHHLVRALSIANHLGRLERAIQQLSSSPYQQTITQSLNALSEALQLVQHLIDLQNEIQSQSRCIRPA